MGIIPANNMLSACCRASVFSDWHDYSSSAVKTKCSKCSAEVTSFIYLHHSISLIPTSKDVYEPVDKFEMDYSKFNFSQSAQKTLKIAFDLDGVVFEYPELFSAFSWGLKIQGHEIYLITDSLETYRKTIEQELTKLNIQYNHLIITDNKEKYCLEQDIDYALDDMADYYTNSKKSSIFLAKVKN